MTWQSVVNIGGHEIARRLIYAGGSQWTGCGRDWERRHPEQAQARKNAWAKSPAGKKWLAKNQKKKNRRRDAWRKRKRRELKKAKSGNAGISDRARKSKTMNTKPQQPLVPTR